MFVTGATRGGRAVHSPAPGPPAPTPHSSAPVPVPHRVPEGPSSASPSPDSASRILRSRPAQTHEGGFTTTAQRTRRGDQNPSDRCSHCVVVVQLAFSAVNPLRLPPSTGGPPAPPFVGGIGILQRACPRDGVPSHLRSSAPICGRTLAAGPSDVEVSPLHDAAQRAKAATDAARIPRRSRAGPRLRSRLGSKACLVRSPLLRSSAAIPRPLPQHRL